MSRWSMRVRALRHYGRTQSGVALGALLSTALIAAAVVVGTSVNETLRQQALLRIGKVQSLFVSQDRFFRADVQPPPPAQGNVDPAATSETLILAQGSVATSGGEQRSGQVQVLGVETGFWRLAPQPFEAEFEGRRGAFVNRALAEELDLNEGDRVVLSVRMPSVISRDAPLADGGESVARLRLTIERILTDTEFGRFSLVNSPLPTPSIWLPRQSLQDLLEVEVVDAVDPEKTYPAANVLLLADANGHSDRLEGDDTTGPEGLLSEAAPSFNATDAGLGVRYIEASDEWEILSRNIFLDTPLLNLITDPFPGGRPTLTYFVNSLEANDRATPYSMVTALEPQGASFLPEDLQDDEVVITQWLADDLGAFAGDSLDLVYFVPEAGGGLREDVSSFTIRSIVPMELPQADPLWMPEFPGLSDADNCRDWETGAPVDLDRIRDKDEAYWDQWRGTPKAFITLAAGQARFANRWGDVTSYRIPASQPNARSAASIVARLNLGLQTDRDSLGLRLIQLRQDALAAARPPNDFGGLLAGFSFFLIVAALTLSALLFVFNLTQRCREFGMLRAVGWSRRAVRQQSLEEGGVVVVAGSVLGLPLGLLLAWLILGGLNTIWADAAGSTPLSLTIHTLDLALAFSLNVLLALVALVIVSWRLLRREPSRLLQGVDNLDSDASPSRRLNQRLYLTGLIGFLLAGLALLGWSALQPFNPALYFGSAFCLLLGGVLFGGWWVARTANGDQTGMTVASLARRNNARRRARSLAVAGALGAGVFMVVGAGAFLQPAQPEVSANDSGAGGFNLFAQTAVPLPTSLNAEDAAEEYGLAPELLNDVHTVPFRVVPGDEASCLNLNQAQQPRLLGVDPAELEGRFRFAQSEADIPPDWSALYADLPEGVLPGIVDLDTLLWSLKQPLGSTLQLTDSRGDPLNVRLVAAVKDSIFQGNVIVDQARLLEHYPDLEGHGFFLIQTPPERATEVSESLSRALGDYGFTASSTARRLAQFNAVENSYIAIFQALGGLGVLLGTLSLGLIVLRNILERRGELALLQASGFSRKGLRSLLQRETRWLVGIGLGSGLITALLAVLPALQLLQPGQIPWLAFVLGLLTALAALGATWVAVRVGMHTVHFDALRDE